MKLGKHFFPHDGILSQKGLCKLVWEGAWQCLPLLMKTALRKGLSLTFRVIFRVTRSFLLFSHETDGVFKCCRLAFPST